MPDVPSKKCRMAQLVARLGDEDETKRELMGEDLVLLFFLDEMLKAKHDVIYYQRASGGTIRYGYAVCMYVLLTLQMRVLRIPLLHGLVVMTVSRSTWYGILLSSSTCCVSMACSPRQSGRKDC